MTHTWTHAELLALTRFNTPTLANALEFASKRSPLEGFNLHETRDFMPHLGPMAGYAVTAEYLASRPADPAKIKDFGLLEVIEASPKPVIVVVRDTDSPQAIVGSLWGECFANACRALGAVGTITDGAIRDYDEMLNSGYHALARRLCVSHAFGHIPTAGQPVEVFGTTVKTGDVIHADQHGFLILPDDCGPQLAEVAQALDRAEQEHMISRSREPGFKAAQWRQCAQNFSEKMRKSGIVKDATQTSGEWAKQ